MVCACEIYTCDSGVEQCASLVNHASSLMSIAVCVLRGVCMCVYTLYTPGIVDSIMCNTCEPHTHPAVYGGLSIMCMYGSWDCKFEQYALLVNQICILMSTVV